MEIIETGVPGLDKLLKGGIPVGNIVLVSGGPGTGKTTLALQYLISGARKGENVIYVTLSQKPAETIKYGRKIFGNDLDLIEFMDFSPSSDVMSPYLTMEQEDHADFGITRLKESISNKIAEKKYTRIVLDPINAFTNLFESISHYRTKMLDFFLFLKSTSLTSFLLYETQALEKESSIAEFLSDGIINLRLVEMGVRKGRAIEILKMRGIDHELTLTPFIIQEDGLKVQVGSPLF